MLMLRDYQEDTLVAIDAWFEEHDGNPCIVLPTGAGKSIVIAEFCRRNLKAYKGIRILILAPGRELVTQNARALREAWPNAPMGIYSSALKRRELYEPITVANIHSIHDKTDLMPVIDILLIDEAHLLPNTDTGMYRKLFTALKIMNPKLVVIGFTATPYRLGQGELTEGPEALFDDLIESATVGDLIRAGWLSRLKSKATELKLDMKGVAKRGGEYTDSAMQKRVDTQDNNYVIANEIAGIAEAHDRQAILVFCTGVAHAQNMAAELDNWFPTAVVTGKTPDAERAKIFADFKARRIRALCNVAIATTGFDYPDIDLIAMVRPTMSKGLYCLDAQTEILTKRGWLGIGQVRVDDVALGMSNNEGTGVWAKVTHTIKRKMRKHEQWIEYVGSSGNFRVTDQHVMLMRSRKKGLAWEKRKAIELPNDFLIPSAVHTNMPGVSLNDAELYLIGILMSDGTWSDTQAQISQSARYPQVMVRIEDALHVLKIAYNSYRSAKAGDKVVINGVKTQRNYDAYTYTISAGDPRSAIREKHPWAERGFRHLLMWLDKTLAPSLMQMTREQFLALWKGVFDGDGIKRTDSKVVECKGERYTPRTQIIVTQYALLADRLLALGAMHGFRMRMRQHAGLYWVGKHEKDYKHVRKLKRTAATDEQVWCVTTTSGSIVTRRGGFVTVMGNCQMAGRGLRIKSHTDYCIIADFAGNVEMHGPITEYEELKAPQKSGGDAPTKKCPKCKEIVFAGYRKCPECGAAFPPPVRKQATYLRDDDIMGQALEPPTVMRVKKWFWWKHTSKKSSKEMLAVRYIGVHLGEDITEYLTVQHDGFAGSNALTTLLKMMKDAGEAGLPDCDTLEEAAEKLNKVRPPSEIEYRLEGRFPKMIRRTFGEMTVTKEEPSDFDNVAPYDPSVRRSSKDDFDDPIPF